MTDEGELLLEEYEKLFTERTKLVSVTQVSNVLGTINPVKEMIRIPRARCSCSSGWCAKRSSLCR